MKEQAEEIEALKKACAALWAKAFPDVELDPKLKPKGGQTE